MDYLVSRASALAERLEIPKHCCVHNGINKYQPDHFMLCCGHAIREIACQLQLAQTAILRAECSVCSKHILVANISYLLDTDATLMFLS